MKRIRLKRLFEPGIIGTMQVKNRLVMAPMGFMLSDEKGRVTQRMIDYYTERAKGGVGLIVSPAIPMASEALPPGAPNMSDDEFVPGWKALVESVHQYGTKIALQLCHPGMIIMEMEKESLEIPVPSILSWMAGTDKFKEMSVEHINFHVEDFVQATGRAKKAGFDALELHACHGSLLGAFLSPLLNRRNDAYGGSAEGRTKFIRQIVEKAKQQLGADFPLTVRVNGNDDIDGGVEPEDAARQVGLLVKSGVNGVSVSAGFDFGSPLCVPCHLYPAGMHVHAAAIVKKLTGTTVVAAGKIDTELGESILKEGKADFIALGRPLVADPFLLNKAREGSTEDIRRCIYCNNCHAPGRQGISCTVNPYLFREKDHPPRPAPSSKKVMVIGGGPAGMQAAVVLGQRGHDVSLYEQSRELGGQWRIGSAMKAKESHSTLTDYLHKELSLAGVEVFTGTEVSRDFVLKHRPDAVIVATGAVPLGLNVPGAERPNVVQANDVIMERVKVGKSVVIIGGRMLGMEMAVQLAEQGKQVALVERDPAIPGCTGRPLEPQTCRALLKRLMELRVPLYPNFLASEVTEKGLLVKSDRGIFLLEADTVVLAIGARSRNTIFDELQGTIAELYRVGDCVEPGTANVATYEAVTVALGI